MKRIFTVKNMARMAILGSLAGVLMSLDFPIGIAPSFYKLDLGNVPCLIASFAMGPIEGLLTLIVKIMVKLLIKGTGTAFVGELADLIISGLYCVIAGIIYKKNKTKNTAIKAIIIGSIVMIVIGSLANYIFIIPAYVNILNFPLEAIIAAGSKIFPIIKNKLDFVLLCVMPFNLIKAILTDILVMLLYKYISPLLKS